MIILLDVRVEPYYWDHAVGMYARIGYEKEAERILKEVRKVCWDCLKRVNELEEEYKLGEQA